MSERITIEYAGKPRDLFMTFGLLHELTSLVGSPDNAGAVGIDFELREAVMARVFGERKIEEGEAGVATVRFVPADVTDLPISIDDAIRVLDWVSENVLDFFLKQLKTGGDLVLRNKDRLEALTSSFPGFRA